MKFTVAASLPLLAGTALAAPTRSTLEVGDSLPESSVHQRSPLLFPPWHFTQKDDDSHDTGDHPTEASVHQRSLSWFWFVPSKEGEKKKEDGHVHPRGSSFSDPELASIGKTIVEALEEVSPETIEGLSGLQTRSGTSDADTRNSLVAIRDDGLAEGRLGKRVGAFNFGLTTLIPLLFTVVDKLKKDKTAAMQRRGTPLSDAELVTVGRVFVETLEGLSPEELESISSLTTDDLATFNSLLAVRAEGQAEGGALERRFGVALIPYINLLLSSHGNEKPGHGQPPAEAPAAVRRDLSGLVVRDFEKDRASLVARDNESSLATRAVPPLFAAGLGIAWIVSLGLTIAEASKNHNEGRGLGAQEGDGSGRVITPDGSIFYHDLEIYKQAKACFGSTPVLEAFENLERTIPKGVYKNFPVIPDPFKNKAFMKALLGCMGRTPPEE